VNPVRQPQLGSVVWAEVEDANGFRKVRPAVIITQTADISSGKPVRVVAITTRLPAPLPDDHVLLPWDRQGKARSGLRQKCAAIASWQAEVPTADVQQVVGVLPPAVIAELLAKVAAATPPPAPPSVAGGGAPTNGTSAGTSGNEAAGDGSP
jgi:mRNA-degrading endonuclease toxin of MazEF toxin-antitoxin module